MLNSKILFVSLAVACSFGVFFETPAMTANSGPTYVECRFLSQEKCGPASMNTKCLNGSCFGHIEGEWRMLKRASADEATDGINSDNQMTAFNDTQDPAADSIWGDPIVVGDGSNQNYQPSVESNSAS
jgi:hypothetical protein